MRKSQIIDYLDRKRCGLLEPLRDELQQMKNDERIKAIEDQYPDFMPAVEKYIESENAVCDILDKMDEDDFQLDFGGIAYRENDTARKVVLSRIWLRCRWQYSADVDALEEKIADIHREYDTVKANIKGMSAKKAIEYLTSLGFDIQPEAPSYLPIAPVDTQLLLGGLQDENTK